MMAPKGFHVVCLEPGADNPKKQVPVPAPGPPEGFVDNTVKVFRLNPDGSKGEFLGTMPAYPEGWDDPQQFREKGFQKKKEEVKEMPKKDIDFEAIVARAKQIMTEQDVSLYKASGIVAQETGLHRTTVYNRAKAMEQTPEPEPVAVGSQEPEREEAESATQSVAQEEPEITVKDVLMCEAAQREQGFGPEDDEPIPYQVAEDATLDEMKVIWIENVLTHCTQAKTQLQYIQAIMDLRV